MRLYLTTVIVSIINYILGDMAFKLNLITPKELYEFIDEEDDDEDDGINSSIFLIFIITMPFINIIVTTLLNIVLIMAKEHSRNSKKR